jgi:hypothetical protein
LIYRAIDLSIYQSIDLTIYLGRRRTQRVLGQVEQVQQADNGQEDRKEAGGKERDGRVPDRKGHCARLRAMWRAQCSNARRDGRRKCHFCAPRNSRLPATHMQAPCLASSSLRLEPHNFAPHEEQMHLRLHSQSQFRFAIECQNENK